MNQPVQRRVARALRAGGPEVIEVAVEQLQPPGTGEALIRVEVAGLNHVETLIRSGNYTVRLPFPYPLGGEGAGVVVAVGPETPISVGARVCWAAVIGSCATFVLAPASMLAPIPDGLGVEDAACLAVAGLTAAGLARVCRRKGSCGVGSRRRGRSNACGHSGEPASQSDRYRQRQTGWTPFAPQGPSTPSIEPLRMCVKR